jgi:hypothetical protein
MKVTRSRGFQYGTQRAIHEVRTDAESGQHELKRQVARAKFHGHSTTIPAQSETAGSLEENWQAEKSGAYTCRTLAERESDQARNDCATEGFTSAKCAAGSALRILYLMKDLPKCESRRWPADERYD